MRAKSKNLTLLLAFFVLLTNSVIAQKADDSNRCSSWRISNFKKGNIEFAKHGRKQSLSRTDLRSSSSLPFATAPAIMRNLRPQVERPQANPHKTVTQVLAGLGSGLILGLAVAAVAPGEEDTPLTLGAIGYVTGIPIGVSLIGKSSGSSGSIPKSFLGGFLGGLASLPIILFVWDKEELAALGAASFLTFPVVGATIGFNL